MPFAEKSRALPGVVNAAIDQVCGCGLLPLSYGELLAEVRTAHEGCCFTAGGSLDGTGRCFVGLAAIVELHSWGSGMGGECLYRRKHPHPLTSQSHICDRSPPEV